MENGTDNNESRRLIGGACIAAVGMIYQQGISFLSLLFVAQVIGAADYGIFNLARNLVQVTGSFTRLGLDLGLQRYFGETNTARGIQRIVFAYTSSHGPTAPRMIRSMADWSSCPTA